MLIGLVLVLRALDQEDEAHVGVYVLDDEDLLEVVADVFHCHDWCFLDPCVLVHRSINSVLACVHREEAALCERCCLDLNNDKRERVRYIKKSGCLPYWVLVS